MVDVDRSEVTADDTDLAYVSVGVADAYSTVDPVSNVLVAVAVRGPAVVQGFASADPLSTEPFTSTTCATYEGRALAVIRPTGAGTIDVEFTAEGMEPASVRLAAVDVDAR